MLVAAAVFIVLNNKPSVFIGAGITAARPRGITAARPKPKPAPKLTSRFKPSTTYRPIRGQQTKQGSKVQEQHERVVKKYEATQAAKLAATQKVARLRSIISTVLNKPNITPAKRKFLMASQIAASAVITASAVQTPQALQQTRAKWKTWLSNFYATQQRQVQQQPRPTVQRVASLGGPDLFDPSSAIQSGGAGPSGGGNFKVNTAQSIQNILTGGDVVENLAKIVANDPDLATDTG